MEQQTDTSEERVREDGSPREAIADLGARINELKEYGSYYISAKIDAAIASVKVAGLYAALGVVALMAGVAVIATAAVLLVVGLGGALGALFGIGWLGNIVIGLIILVGVGFGMRAAIGAMKAKWHHKTVEKYESRQRQQASEFGRSVHDRATAPSSTARE